MDDIFQVARFTQPASPKEMLPCHVCYCPVDFCVDCEFLISKFKATAPSPFVAQSSKRFNESIYGVIQSHAVRPVAYWGKFDWPPLARGIASSPRNALICVVVRAFGEPLRIHKTRKHVFNVGTDCAGRSEDRAHLRISSFPYPSSPKQLSSCPFSPHLPS
jgi:hypothetical protein